MTNASSTGSTPITSESRPPYIRRETMSRPSSSVPRRKPGLPIGSSLRSMLVLYGSAGATHGANTANEKIRSTTAPAARLTGSRRSARPTPVQ